jgi:hypothetical protein
MRAQGEAGRRISWFFTCFKFLSFWISGAEFVQEGTNPLPLLHFPVDAAVHRLERTRRMVELFCWTRACVLPSMDSLGAPRCLWRLVASVTWEGWEGSPEAV